MGIRDCAASGTDQIAVNLRVALVVMTLPMALIFSGCVSKSVRDRTEVTHQVEEDFSKVVKIDTSVVGSFNADTVQKPKESLVGPAPPVATLSEKTSIGKKAIGEVSEVKPDKGGLESGSKAPGKVTKKNKKDSEKKTESAADGGVGTRQPELESSVGFDGRRPLVEPYRVGEKISHAVKYFALQAGTLDLAVKPFALVNGRQSYFFQIAIKTTGVFSAFYEVDDYVDIMMDYFDLVPPVFALHVKESAQDREARAYFDFKKNQAKFWETKVTKKDGKEERRLEWEILPYSQNVYSAAFYMRFFKWEVGKEVAFRVSHDGENLIFRGKAIRREKLRTEAGDFDAIVIKPEVELRGVFKPVGDNYIWLSDDDRKFILRIESKIRIGTLVSEVTSIDPGK